MQSSITLAAGLLVEADHVAPGIAKARGDFRRVRADRLHELAAGSDDRVNRGGHAINHDVDEQPGRRRRRPPRDPGAAHFPHAIIEGGRAVTALSDPPAENLFIEFSRPPDVARRNLDVANLPVSQSWSHKRACVLSLFLLPTFYFLLFEPLPVE